MTDSATYFERVAERFDEGAAASGEPPVERWFAYGDRAVVTRFAGPALVDGLTAAMGHLAIDPQPTADLVLHAFDRASTGVRLPDAAWPNTAYGAKGLIEGFNDDDFSTVFAPGTDLFHMYDHGRGLGFFWIDDASDLPYWESGFPFRTLLHWSTHQTERQLVHSAAIGRGDRGVLITGVGGSGKSTTALNCLLAGLDYAADDYVGFELGQPPTVQSLYSSAKVHPATLARFPSLRPHIANADNPDDEKRLLQLHPGCGERLTRGFDVTAILLPVVSGEATTRVERATPVAAVKALAPTTVFQLPRFDTEVFAKISQLANRVPSFHLRLGTDMDRIPAVVAAAIDGEIG